MYQYLPQILTVALIHVLGVMSPGPDFVLVTRNALIYSRKAGIYSALGIALGLWVHMTYTLLGLALVITRSPLIFTLMKYLGVFYLLFIAYNSLMDKKHKEVTVDAKRKHISPLAALRMGFITNATNPKVTLFFLSLFTVVVSAKTPTAIKLFMGLEMSSATALWFTLVAVVFSHGLLKKRLGNFQFYAEKIMGVVLVLLAIELFLYNIK